MASRIDSKRAVLTFTLAMGLGTIVVSLSLLTPPAGGALQGQPTPATPVLDRTLVAETSTAGQISQANAWFGWTLSAGKLGAPGADLSDDLVAAAILHDTGVATDGGAGFIFSDTNLSTFANELKPDNTFDSRNAHTGELGNAIGNVRGSGQANLVFLGAPGHAKDFQSTCGAIVGNLGAVFVYNPLTDPSGDAVLKLEPPADPGQCYPMNTAAFGHSVAVGDLDGDGFNDLAVGAHSSDNDDGRVYIFFGYSGFLTNPSQQKWIVIKPPTTPAITPDLRFGTDLEIANLDTVAGAELIVGASQRRANPGECTLFAGVTSPRKRR